MIDLKSIKSLITKGSYAAIILIVLLLVLAIFLIFAIFFAKNLMELI